MNTTKNFKFPLGNSLPQTLELITQTVHVQVTIMLEQIVLIMLP